MAAIREKIGVFLPNWIGDVVMATPTLRALRRRFPEAELIGVQKPYTAEVLRGTPWLDRSIFFDPAGSQAERGWWSVVWKLRAEGLSKAILLPNSLASGLLAWLGGAGERIGYDRDWRGWLLTQKLAPPVDAAGKFEPISAVDYYLELAKLLACDASDRSLELATTDEDEAAADRAWHELGLPPDGPVIVFNGGGGSGKAAAKDWTAENFADLAREVVQAFPDWHVLMNCGPKERETAARIEQAVAHPRVTSLARFAPEELTLGLTKACIRRSQAMVSTDSGPRHIATAFGLPVVGLFGPIDPRWSDTHDPRAIALVHRVPCQPCGEAVCPLVHNACMRDLPVERVFNAVARHLVRHGERRIAA